MKKLITIVILCTLCVAAGAEEKAARKVDGKTTLWNGNHNVALTLYGGATYVGDFQSISRENIFANGGAELVYNYFGLRTSIGGAWGQRNSSYGQIGVYWNFVNNPNRKSRGYIGVTGGLTQYSAVVNRQLLLKGEGTLISFDESIKMGLKLPPNSVAPIVGLRLGADWRLAERVYLTTAVEGIYNFTNPNVTFKTFEESKELSDLMLNISLKDLDQPLPINHWGLRALVGITIRLK